MTRGGSTEEKGRGFMMDCPGGCWKRKHTKNVNECIEGGLRGSEEGWKVVLTD